MTLINKQCSVPVYRGLYEGVEQLEKQKNLCCSYKEDHRDSNNISFLIKNYQLPGKFTNPQISLHK